MPDGHARDHPARTVEFIHSAWICVVTSERRWFRGWSLPGGRAAQLHAIDGVGAGGSGRFVPEPPPAGTPQPALPVREGRIADPAGGPEDQERDRALMRLVVDRDEQALAALYDRYAALVNGLAVSILRNPTVAEEATHDVFLRLWQQPAAYDPARGSFAGWLLRVTRNRAIDLIRRRREDAIGEMDEDPLAWIADPAPDPEEQAMTRIRRQEVRRALADLAPEQRQLLELAYDAGLSQRQIAERLDRPLGTVKSQIRAAMRLLADRLVAADGQPITPANGGSPSPHEEP
jgi:RNA polymerase sigma-70 factor (ECF subfamily)